MVTEFEWVPCGLHKSEAVGLQPGLTTEYLASNVDWDMLIHSCLHEIIIQFNT